MFRKNKNGDISNEEYQNIVVPFNDVFCEYLSKYALPDICAFYIAFGYRSNAEWESSLESHLNSVLAIINCEQYFTDELISRIKDILKIKYGLIIIETDPLKFDEVVF